MKAPRKSRRARARARVAALWSALVAPPANAVGRLAWRCRRAGLERETLAAIGNVLIARMQESIVKVGHEPPPAPMPTAAEAEGLAATVAAAAVEPDGAIIYAWPGNPEPVPDLAAAARMMSLRAWMDYMLERGRLSQEECSRLAEIARTQEGIQYLVRLRDFYEGGGPYPDLPRAAGPAISVSAA